MAHFLKNLFLVFGFLLLGHITVLADGREATVLFNDGTSKSGELLFVRDSVIGLLTRRISDDREIVYYSENIVLAKVNDIRNITLHEYNPSGALTGALVGAGIGAALGIADIVDVDVGGGDSRAHNKVVDEMFTKTLWGAATGLSVGWLVATLRSKDERTLSLKTYNEILYLYQSARFDGEEPSYLHDIINNLLQETN